jgi:hypothetical protein
MADPVIGRVAYFRRARRNSSCDKDKRMLIRRRPVTDRRGRGNTQGIIAAAPAVVCLNA